MSRTRMRRAIVAIATLLSVLLLTDLALLRVEADDSDDVPRGRTGDLDPDRLG